MKIQRSANMIVCRKAMTIFLVVIVTCIGMIGANRKPLPSGGIVPDKLTAVKIAEAVFEPIFGAEEVSEYLPYHAQLKNGVWTVYGTLKRGSRGGTPQLTIQKKDGKVIEVWHSL
jgi:hypothetical protein